MSPTAADSLLGVFQHLTDPRDPRGVRHPFVGLLAIVFLGLLSRQPDFASIARWAKRHWSVLKPAFGLTYRCGPHATTYSRAAALFSVDPFRTALARWLSGVMGSAPVTSAVDGKTSKPADDEDGDPIHVLNVFAHGANVCRADWAVGEGKETEPEVLKAHLDELFAAWPSLRVWTGDAIFCQRPLARAIIESGRDYVLVIKDNQPDLFEAAWTAFADATVFEKSAGRSRRGVSGATRPRPTTHARR